MVYINSVPRIRHNGTEQPTHYLLISVIVWGVFRNFFPILEHMVVTQNSSFIYKIILLLPKKKKD